MKLSIELNIIIIFNTECCKYLLHTRIIAVVKLFLQPFVNIEYNELVVLDFNLSNAVGDMATLLSDFDDDLVLRW